MEMDYNMTFLVGNENILLNINKTPALPIFSDILISFLNDLSKRLRRNAEAKEMQDVLSYAFWIRKASVEKEKNNHINIERRMGRGVTFHIAPSNVPINFAVSMTSALLAGNACIIRVSNKQFEQVNIVCNEIRYLLDTEYEELKRYICIVRYEHDLETTQMLSNMCDVRIIWGGNETINLIRQAKLPPRAIEMAFADRYSLAIIDAEQYLKCDKQEIAELFYTDTYYSDQNACSSPRIVIWTGKNKELARKFFWSELESIVKDKYELHPIQVINKLDSFCRLTAKNGDGFGLITTSNYLYRVQVDELTEKLMEYKEAGGYFFEYLADSVDEVVPILGKKCQTVAVLGIEESQIRDLVYRNGVRGVDRIVSLGKTMELSFKWDGYDMIETMSRII